MRGLAIVAIMILARAAVEVEVEGASHAPGLSIPLVGTFD